MIACLQSVYCACSSFFIEYCLQRITSYS